MVTISLVLSAFVDILRQMVLGRGEGAAHVDLWTGGWMAWVARDTGPCGFSAVGGSSLARPRAPQGLGRPGLRPARPHLRIRDGLVEWRGGGTASSLRLRRRSENPKVPSPFPLVLLLQPNLPSRPSAPGRVVGWGGAPAVQGREELVVGLRGPHQSSPPGEFGEPVSSEPGGPSTKPRGRHGSPPNTCSSLDREPSPPKSPRRRRSAGDGRPSPHERLHQGRFRRDGSS